MLSPSAHNGVRSLKTGQLCESDCAAVVYIADRHARMHRQIDRHVHTNTQIDRHAHTETDKQAQRERKRQTLVVEAARSIYFPTLMLRQV